jgi:hypothetical protein
MGKKICYVTTMTELPANCLECTVFGCDLPNRKNRSGVTDICKIAYRTKRHKDCPLIEVEENEQ